jgi:hypothetical protein
MVRATTKSFAQVCVMLSTDNWQGWPAWGIALARNERFDHRSTAHAHDVGDHRVGRSRRSSHDPLLAHDAEGRGQARG